MSHPALESFDDLDAAARDPHVAGCPHCQADLGTQRQVRALLAALPDPGPTPPDVVDRLEATLRRLHAEQGSPPGAASTVVPIAAARERRQRVWWAAAAAVVVLGGGAAAVSQIMPGSRAADSSAAGASLSQAPRSKAQPDAALAARASGTDYTTARLAAQVDQVLAQRTAVAPARPTGPLASPAGVAACLSAIGAPGATPLLVDVARYQGRPAAVVVLPASGGGREIWVVSPTCSPGQDGTRYFTTLR